MRQPLRLLVLAALLAVLAPVGADANGPDDFEDLGEQLEEELLKDLQKEFDGPDGTPRPNRKEGDPSSDRPSRTAPDGEDVDLTGPDDPVARIGRRMQSVGRRIGTGDVSAETQRMQERVVADLDALMKSIRRRPPMTPTVGASSTARTTRRSWP